MPGILSSLMQAKRESFFLFSGCGGGWIHLHIQRSFKKPPLSLPHCVVCGGLGEPSKGGANGFTAGILSSPPSTLGANALRIVCPESFFPRILELSDPPLERSFSGRKDFTLFPFPMCGTTRKKMFRGRCNFPVCALLPSPPPSSHCTSLRFFRLSEEIYWPPFVSGKLVCVASVGGGNGFFAPSKVCGMIPILRFSECHTIRGKGEKIAHPSGEKHPATFLTKGNLGLKSNVSEKSS